MNCENFQDRLYEYVEGTFSSGECAKAEEHLAGCAACRRAAEKEQKLSQSLSNQLQQSSEALTLRPDIRRNILAALREKTTSPAIGKSLAGLWSYWLRLAVVPASLLVIAALLAIHFHDTRGHQTFSVPVNPSAHNNPEIAVSVHMSYRLPTRQFHQEGNLVVDTLIDETVVASGTFQPGGKESVSPKLEMKTPL
jgi:predicted anti-sigma-YlaC factor YlaD